MRQKPLGGRQVPFGSRNAVQVRQRLGQPAELHVQDCLHVLVAQRRGPPVHPVGQSDRDIECSPDPGELVGVDQAGQVLVDHVVRRPDLLVLPGLKQVEEMLGERGQVPGRVTGFRSELLQPRQLGDQVLGPGLRRLVAGIRVGKRKAGQQVTGGVPANLAVR